MSKCHTIGPADLTSLDVDKNLGGQFAVSRRIANPKDIKDLKDIPQATFYDGANDASREIPIAGWCNEAEISLDRMRAYPGQAFADSKSAIHCRLVRDIMLERRIGGATKLAKAADSRIVSLQDLFTWR